MIIDPIELDLGSKQGETLHVAGHDSLVLQATLIDAASSVAVIAVRASLSGRIADAVDLSPPVTITPDGSISDPIDVREIHSVHLIPTTTDTGRTAQITGALTIRS